MKKFLPIFFFLTIILSFFFTVPLYATSHDLVPTPTSTPVLGTPTPTSVPGRGVGAAPITPDGSWTPSPEVTFVGKLAARANNFLEWTFSNYSWVNPEPGESSNSIGTFWATIRNIVYAFLVLFVLVTAFIIIVTRGRNITVMRFIPHFVLVLVLVTFSFALVQFLYQITDIIQNFFLRYPGEERMIKPSDLLSVAFSYADFKGYRIAGDNFDESAFITLLLLKVTSITYFILGGILLVRKVILWFFIILSPLFPLLLLYGPTRNSAKIWIGEFLRWLLYAPLFSILLFGLVSIWQIGIPLNFTDQGAGFRDPLYNKPAVNIMLGAPGEQISPDSSLSSPAAFAKYVVALIMLWAVILLPFVLLHIFLEYYHSLVSSDSTFVKQIAKASNTFLNKNGTGPPGSKGPAPGGGAGIARVLPFGKLFQTTAPATPIASVPLGRESVSVSANSSPLSGGAGLARAIPTSSERTFTTSIPRVETTQSSTFSQAPTAVPRNTVISNAQTTATSQTTQVPAFSRGETPVVVSSGAQSYNQTTQVKPKSTTSAFQATNTQTQSQQNRQTTKASDFSRVETKFGFGAGAASQNQTTRVEPNITASAFQAGNNQTQAQQNTQTNVRQSTVTHSASFSTSAASVGSVNNQTQSFSMTPAVREVLQTANLQVPTMRDIARFDTATHTSSSTATNTSRSEMTKIKETLQSIANPGQAQTKQAQFSVVKNRLTQESQKGSPVAQGVLNASKVVAQNTTTMTKNQRSSSSQTHVAGSPTSILSKTNSSVQTTAGVAPSLPQTNRVQSVSLDDYESVKKMWTENYEKLEPPISRDGIQKNKSAWVQEDIQQITHVIDLLSSSDKTKQQEGMNLVSDLLPFLLIGGFSQAEVIAYLKAKLEAAKSVKGQEDKKDEEEDTLLDKNENKKEEQKEMHASAEEPEDKKVESHSAEASRDKEVGKLGEVDGINDQIEPKIDQKDEKPTVQNI